MRFPLCTALMLGLLAAACQAAPPAPPARSAASTPSQGYTPNYANAPQDCADYGFAKATPAFETCVSRERAARAAGRVGRDYPEARLTDDARAACASYGLLPGAVAYQTCITREVGARRYQG